MALGLVSSDSFSGLRALLLDAVGERNRWACRKRIDARVRHRGRWPLALLRRHQPAERPSGYIFEHDPDTVEAIVNVLLRRYGVVFWRLLQREAAWLPPWRDLLRVLRRLEARGDLRGGRFVAGISGEQFALPEAVSALRDARRTPPQQTLVSVSGADPLNLAGILLPGPKVLLDNNRLLYRDGAASPR